LNEPDPFKPQLAAVRLSDLVKSAIEGVEDAAQRGRFQLRVESGAAEGTTFSITLPRAPAARAEVAPSESHLPDTNSA